LFKFSALVAVLLFSPLAVRAQTAGDEEAIRHTRIASNTAIANHDVPGILATLEEEYRVAASSGVFINSAAEMGEAFASRFAESADAVYVRTTETIELSESGPFAAETGVWTGEWDTPSGPFRTGGRYVAYWRKSGTKWLIHAELYVPLFCQGSDCIQAGAF
jgi:ketosteroid isomerase-like protein